jgi:ABC-type amino acid transport substrate-binding protein
MKLERAFLGAILRWLHRSITPIFIGVATLTIVLIANPLARLPTSAQPKPSPTLVPASIGEPTPPVINGQTFKVATRLVSPFVIEEKGELGGFSIELWKNIAQELGVKSDFVKNADVSSLLNSVKSKQAAIGISAISVTSQREKKF